MQNYKKIIGTTNLNTSAAMPAYSRPTGITRIKQTMFDQEDLEMLAIINFNLIIVATAVHVLVVIWQERWQAVALNEKFTISRSDAQATVKFQLGLFFHSNFLIYDERSLVWASRIQSTVIMNKF